MKIKHLIIVSLVLAILTLGAVSASEDVSDNNLTADSQDSIIESTDNEVELNTDDAGDVISDEENLIEDYHREVQVKDDYLESDGKSVNLYLPGDATGEVEYTFDDDYTDTGNVYHNEGDDYSFSYYYFSDLELGNGEHNVKITYSGDEKYKGFTFEKTFTIAPIAINFPSEIAIGDSYDEIYDHIIEVIEDIEGNITIWIDDEIFISGDFDTVVHVDYDEVDEYYIPVNLDDYSLGPHTYKITYDLGDGEITRTGSFNVTYYMWVDVFGEDYGQPASIRVTLPHDATSNITVIVNGRTLTYQSKGRTTEIPLNNVEYGENTITVTYSDENYPERSITKTLNVKSRVSEIYQIMYGNGEGFSLELPSDATGQLSIYLLNYNWETDKYEIGELIESIPITGGTVFYDVSEWNLGHYDIKFILENGNYQINDDNQRYFTVYPNVEYNTSVIVGEDAQALITVPENAAGNLTVKIYEFNSEDYYEESEPIATYENQYTIPLGTETPKFYTIMVEYSDEVANIHLSRNYMFKVFEEGADEWEFHASIPTQVLPQYWCSVDFNYPDGGDGIFVLYIDGKQVNSYQLDGINDMLELGFDAEDFSLGTHDWEVRFVNDSFYKNKTQSGTVEIVWAVVPEIVEVGGDSQYITIKINGINKGTVDLYLDGEKADTIELANGYAEYMLENLTQNHIYNYELRYIEGNLTRTGSFNVSYVIAAYVDDAIEDYESIFYKQYNDLTVILPNEATGNIEVITDGGTFTGVLENGQAIIPVKLHWRKNTITIKYGGDGVFLPKTFEKIVDVYDTRVTGEVVDGKLTSISIFMPEDANGELILYADYNEVTRVQVENGTATIKVDYDALPLGCYQIRGEYLSDNWDYYPYEYYKYVSVEPEMTIPEKIIIGDGCNIIINLPDATGDMEVFVDGETKGNFAATDGIFNITLADLALGTHTVTFNYNGWEYSNLFKYYDEDDYEYYPIEYTVNVVKPDAGLKASAEDVFIGQNATIIIEINENINGNVTININGEDEKIEINNGRGIYTIPDLTVNEYNYTIAFSGDDDFAEDAQTVTFKVKKLNARIEVINDVNEYKNDKFTFKVINTDSGAPMNNVSVSLTIIGNIRVGFTAKTDENGIASFKTANLYYFTSDNMSLNMYPLNVGKHLVNMEIRDSNINASILPVNLTITPAHIKISISEYDEYYGSDSNLTFTVTNVNGEALAGEVFKFNIPGFTSETFYVATNVNGTGAISLKNVTKGTYEVIIANNNTDDIVGCEARSNVTVKPLDGEFKANASDVMAGENATITVTANKEFEGFVIINIGGEDKFIQMAGGQGILNLGELDAGNYTFTVSFKGDKRFTEGSCNVSFKVILRDAGFKANASDVSYGENATVTVSINKNFTGNVTISVDGADKIISLIDGEGKYVLTDLAAGNYTYTVSFSGDKRFAEGSANVSFEVTKISPELTISEIGEVKQGNDAVIYINANELFTGEVTVQVGAINTTATIKNGKGNVTVSTDNLEVGEVTVNVISIENTNFKVDDATAKFNITVKPDAGSKVTIPDNVTSDGFDVVLPEDATGGIYVTVDGNRTYIPLVNGTAKVDLANLSEGSHNITVEYTGDSNYAGFVKNTTVTVVPKESKTVPVKIVAKDLTVQYYDGTKYSVTVYGADGNLAANAEVVFKIDGKKVATVKTNAKGIATLSIKQLPKSYKITAEALGSSVTKKLTVKRVLTLKKVTVKRSAKKLVLKATLKKVKGKYLKGKKITFKFKGKKYTAKTNKKGVAKVTVKKNVLKKLKKGKKVTYTATYMKDTVKKTVKVKK